MAATVHQTLGLQSVVQDALSAKDLERAIQNLQLHLRDPSYPYDQTVRYQPTKGSAVWIRTRGMAIRDSDGKAARMLGTYTNVTEQQQVSVELEHQRQKANQRNRYLADFAAIASHDLKAPLRRISTLTSLLETELKGADESALKLMAMIKSNAEVMQQSFDDLKSLARLETEKLTMATMSLESIVQQVLLNLNTDLWEGEIQVECLPKVRGDETMLATLIQHLVSNSMVYHNGSNPTISVSGGELEDTTWFCVSDNGIGIASEHQKRIFDAFQRLNARDAYHKGTGLGLTMCQRIVELHHGSIEVFSNPEEGARVKVILPR